MRSLRRALIALGAIAALVLFAVSGAPVDADRARPPVRTLDEDVCGIGRTGVSTASAGSFCFHAADDVLGENLLAPAATPVAPKCYGNGVNGPRVQLLYAYQKGKPNRSGEIVPKILNRWAPNMEGSVRMTSREQGREIGIRFHAPGCKISVEAVELEIEAEEFGDVVSQIANGLVEAGYKSPQRKYLTWYDGHSEGGACGVALESIFARPLAAAGPTPVRPPIQTYDNPTPANPYNLGPVSVGPFVASSGYAIAFRAPGEDFGFSTTFEACWGTGGMGAVTEAHELLHTMGAVQMSAPNSDGLAHCTDATDIMCYAGSAEGIKVRPRCSSRVELLDCGQDDYFSARAQAGSYLSTHWNVANSMFLGTVAGFDDIPTELPRP